MAEMNMLVDSLSRLYAKNQSGEDNGVTKERLKEMVMVGKTITEENYKVITGEDFSE